MMNVLRRRPRPFYGFYIVAACFVVLFMLWGMVINTFPIFLKPLSDSMGWSREAVSVALLMGAVGMILSAPIAGKLLDRIGARPVMAAGTVAVGCGLIAASRVTQLWQIQLLFGLIGVGLICSTVIPCSLVISNWFVSQRGTAMGAAFVGTSIGGMAAAYLTNWIILNYSWRAAFLFSGVCILVVVTPVVLLVIRTRPADLGLEPYHNPGLHGEDSGRLWGVGVKEALSMRVFWQIAAIMFIVGLVSGGVGNHSVAYLTDLGHSPTAAAVAWMIVMGVMTFGKLAFGRLSDLWGARTAMAWGCVLYAVGITVLLFAQPYWVAILYAVVYGFASGAPLTINPLLTADYLGMRNFGTLYGVLNITATIGGAVGPVAAGAAFSRMQTYLPVFYVFIALMLLAAMCSMSIHAAGKRVARQGR
jgi:MFS family permease